MPFKHLVVHRFGLLVLSVFTARSLLYGRHFDLVVILVSKFGVSLSV